MLLLATMSRLPPCCYASADEALICDDATAGIRERRRRARDADVTAWHTFVRRDDAAMHKTGRHTPRADMLRLIFFSQLPYMLDY